MSSEPAIQPNSSPENSDISSKQQLLKENIIDKGFNGSSFIKHLELARLNGADLSKWTLTELEQEIEVFKKNEALSTRPLISLGDSKPIAVIGIKPKNGTLFNDSDEEDQTPQQAKPDAAASFDPKKSRLEAYIQTKGNPDSDEEDPSHKTDSTPENEIKRHRTTMGAGLVLDVEMQIADQALIRTVNCLKM
jgi:hypothetical protein